ncbi:MAG: hypothetical protein QMD53_00115 [Actinomycetota bacterium]|nr:hypothetical protein [Actinomycetota bacterium]
MIKREDGISIVEIMIAAMIMAIALLAMMYMFQFSITHTSDSGGKTVAVQLAVEKLEEIRNMGYSSIDDAYYQADGSDPGSEPDFKTPAETVSGLSGGTRQVRICYQENNLNSYTTPINVIDDPPRRLLKVWVRVSWTANTGPRYHEEATLIYGG